jgi:small subunit ribosomal protein S21
MKKIFLFCIFRLPLRTEKLNLILQVINNKKDMIIVPIKEGENIEKALKKFKRKFEKTGVVKELRDRQAFTKFSVRRREQIKKAIYIQKLQRMEADV